jgi:hypothetical protein
MKVIVNRGRLLQEARALGLLLLAASAFAQPGARYLIIASDPYISAIQPLIEWKQKQGFPCFVYPTSKIGTNNEIIRDSIVSAYDHWSPRPEYILLVGCGADIPAFSVGSWEWPCETDSRYADVKGDYAADLPYGRFPCRSARECSVMVARTIAYERHPYVGDTMWYRKGTTVVNDTSFQDSSGGTYWDDVRYAAGLAETAGYSSFDSLSAARGNTASDVAQSVANGTSFVMYRGHSVNYWFAPFNMVSLLPALTNGPRWPILCSFSCQIIDLDAYNDSMTGNTWVKVGTPQSPQGAVATVANTHDGIGMADERSAVCRGYFERLFSDSVPILGNAVLQGKMKLKNEYDDTVDYYGFNLLGDPSLLVYTTTPKPAEVTCDSTVKIGPDTFTLTVTRAGVPVNNALVCIRNAEDSIYQYACTDTTGTATLHFTTTQSESLELTVTGTNCIPYEGLIYTDTPATAISNRSPRPILKPVTGLTVRPSLGNGSFAISCPPNARVTVFNPVGRAVKSFAATRSAAGFTWNVSNMPAGVYIVRAQTPDSPPESRTLLVTR